MHSLIRDSEELKGISLDSSLPLFLDTETYEEEGKSKGGLYGKVRLVQMFQVGWEEAIIIDALFVPLPLVLDLICDQWQVWHNAPYDLHTINCSTEGLYLPERLDDTIYLARLTFFDKSKFGFYECLKYCGEEDGLIKGMDKKASQKADWGGPLSSTLLRYAEYDVTYLAKLWLHVNQALTTVSYKLDINNLRYAIEYSRRGVPVDQPAVNKELLRVSEELEQCLEALPVNPNSPKQCKELLGTDSSDMDTLVHLSLQGNKLAQDVRDARQLSKTRGYLVKYIRPVIKGFFNPCAAISGRFSCTGGDRYGYNNLQQIPRRLLPVLRALPGRVFVYKDYAGLELRMAVAWTGEPTMERMMRAGEDLHIYTGCIVFNVGPDQLTKHQRMIGKILNFSLVFGAGIATVMSMLRSWGGIILDAREVSMLKSAWFAEYEYFDEWHKMHKKHLGVYGYLDITTALGRRIRTYSLADSLNTPIQGSSSEVQKTGLLMLKNRYPDENLICTIHDSNTLMPLEEEAELWRDRLNECMVDAWFSVTKGLTIPDLPMPAEAEISTSWDF